MENLCSYENEGWDKLANSTLLSTGGVTAPFSIDALNLTIPKEKVNEAFSILDVGCGVGVLSLYASSMYPNCSILATDYSKLMVNSLNETIKSKDIKNIKTMVVDGQDMVDIKDEQFNYCYSMFGLIFFPNRIKGLKECYRVLKRGGSSKVAISSWQSTAFLPMLLQLSYEKLTNGSKVPYKQPVLSLDDSNLFKSELEDAGFKNVVIHNVVHSFNASDFTALTSRDNPVVDDFYKLLNCDDNKFKEFITILTETIKEICKKNNDGTFIIEWPAFIGVGDKL